MILECSACRTRYLVPDTAIGPEGRTVRCANCKHSWFQEGAAQALAEAAAKGESLAPPTAPEREASDQPQSTPEPVANDADYDAFGYREPFRPRRNPARRYTAVAVATGVAMLVGVGLVSSSGATGLAARLGLAASQSPALQIRQNPIDRRALPSGAELFAVSGQIVNPTNRRQPVSDILAELRDVHGRAVYSWTITPEARMIAPGGQIEFKSAMVNVPDNAKRLDLSFATSPVG